MQMINFTYTQYFNRKYGKVGYLFQGRYKFFLCDKDGYLLSLVRYIHHNPVRADLAKDSSDRTDAPARPSLSKMKLLPGLA
jgi:REP element-mobilizing transposase RayT